jgi:hypothetical protein
MTHTNLSLVPDAPACPFELHTNGLRCFGFPTERDLAEWLMANGLDESLGAVRCGWLEVYQGDRRLGLSAVQALVARGVFGR